MLNQQQHHHHLFYKKKIKIHCKKGWTKHKNIYKYEIQCMVCRMPNIQYSECEYQSVITLHTYKMLEIFFFSLRLIILVNINVLCAILTHIISIKGAIKTEKPLYYSFFLCSFLETIRIRFSCNVFISVSFRCFRFLW